MFTLCSSSVSRVHAVNMNALSTTGTELEDTLIKLACTLLYSKLSELNTAIQEVLKFGTLCSNFVPTMTACTCHPHEPG